MVCPQRPHLHHQGDAEFAARPDTTVIGLAPTDVAKFFGVTDWPRQIATFDLGGRALSIIPTPGHEPAHIAIYDPKTRFLLSGDTLYPGRLYVPANWFGPFRDSMHRLAKFVREHPVSYLLGAHIEMTTTPGKDYGFEAPAHPDERILELAPEAAYALERAVDGMGESVQRVVTDDFIVFPVDARLPDP
jgi:hydroxyacylglutathione hydrolase